MTAWDSPTLSFMNLQFATDKSKYHKHSDSPMEKIE